MIDQLLRIPANLPAADKSVVLERGLPVSLQNKVLLERIVQHQPVFMAILRNMAHTQLAAFSDGRAGDIVLLEENPAGGRLFQSGQSVNKFRLAIALDSRQTNDFAAAHLKGNILDRVVLVNLAGHGQVFDAEHHIFRLARLFVYLKFDIPADHHAGELLLGRVLYFHRTDALALAQNRAAVGYGHNLIQFMGDEQDGLPFPGEVPHDFHQLVDFLRRQHRGGLIEDQNFIVAIEHFQYFDTLLHADGNIFDLCIRIDGQSVFFGECDNLFARLLFLQKTELVRLNAEDDVVQCGIDLHQLEVLVYHTDVQGVGVVRVLDPDDFAVLFDGAGFRLI